MTISHSRGRKRGGEQQELDRIWDDQAEEEGSRGSTTEGTPGSLVEMSLLFFVILKVCCRAVSSEWKHSILEGSSLGLGKVLREILYDSGRKQLKSFRKSLEPDSQG